MSQVVRFNESRINNINNTNISISVPFSNTNNWFSNTTNTTDTIVENIKAYLFTNKNERVMRHDFGLGLNKYLFEQIDKNLKNIISHDINTELSKNFPYVELMDLQIITNEDDYSIHANSFKIILTIRIKFANEFVVKTFDKIIK